MTDLTALIAELERATEGSSGLDLKIAIALGNAPADAIYAMDDPEGGSMWHTPAHLKHQAALGEIHQREGNGPAFKEACRAAPRDAVGTAPPYTFSIDAALSLVPEGFSYLLKADNIEGGMEFEASVNWGGRRQGATMALAICLAALICRRNCARTNPASVADGD